MRRETFKFGASYIRDFTVVTRSYYSVTPITSTQRNIASMATAGRRRTPSIHMEYTVNTLRPRQNGRHFADDMFKCIFLNENVWIPIEISLKFVPKGSINNNPALFWIMAWRRPGDKPLSEPMMVSSLTHICVTRPQWVKTFSLRLWYYPNPGIQNLGIYNLGALFHIDLPLKLYMTSNGILKIVFYIISSHW